MLLSSTKQEAKSRIFVEAKLIAVDDKTSKIMQTKKFMEAQGIKVNSSAIFEDNASAIKLAKNGKVSLGKRVRHFNTHFFTWPT